MDIITIKLCLILTCLLYFCESKPQMMVQNRICSCPRVYEPVCASDGRTYPNPCQFRCVAETAYGRRTTLRILREGRCTSISNGYNTGGFAVNKTIRGYQVIVKKIKLKMENSSIKLMLFITVIASIKGKPQNNNHLCTCPQTYKPVCGSNGRTYPNTCLFRCQAETPYGRRTTLRILRDGNCNW
uniref:CSON013823 protein n=1 Tax=Culicoides sonorensis TaxID=179676 RepID=A0A336ML68_CULSO